MIAHPKRFAGGVVLMVLFLVVLVLMFMPLYGGQNALDFMDSLYNSISKGSANYISDLQELAKAQAGNQVQATLDLPGEVDIEQAGMLFQAAGVSVDVTGSQLVVDGDLGSILGQCLDDSMEMYNNNGEVVLQRYGYDEKRVLFNWWHSLKAMDKSLNRQERFAEAAVILTVKKKAVECAYNYYGIEPMKITDKIGIVLFSLIFYVVYTVWYGYAIIFMFEGWGLNLSH